MQDSLEDYIQLTRNVKQDNPIKISKEVQITAQLKKECDNRAFKIVEMSIDGKLRVEVFTRCLPYINQCHYQDIVEERAITKLCGYSICGKKIPEMPKKQFFISTKCNRVYDITERKNFCSNFCYKASLHIKNQLDNSPLWLRKLEDIPEYTLLNSSEGGLPGEYVDQGIIKPSKSDDNFTSISSFTNLSLDDMVQREINPKNGELTSNKVQNNKRVKKSSRRLKNTMQTIKENDIESVEEDSSSSDIDNDTKKPERNHKITLKKDYHLHAHKKSNVINLPAIEENEEKPPESNDKLNIENVPSKIETNPQGVINKKPKKPKSTNASKNNSQKVLTDVENIIKNSLNDWLTLETFIYIHGEQKIKNILDEKKLSEYFEELKISELQRHQQIKYMEICKRLQVQEMADEKFDEALVGNSKLKPLPDYKKLKEQSKELNLKVKSFYTGTVYEKEDTNFPTKKNDKTDEQNAEDGPPAVLPPVDVNSQTMMRRKIFLGSINKAMQQILQSLGVRYYSSILSDIQCLVKTFKLSSDNIVFKPVVLNYISIVLLHILSVKDKNVKDILDEERSEEFLKLLLNSLPNKTNLINEVMETLQNIELFVENYITKKAEL